MKITRSTKRNLILELIKHNIYGRFDEGFDTSLPFLLRIWPELDDPKKMHSFDNRFSSAYEDIRQHMVNNSDWLPEYLFTERLDLLDNEERFIKFLEELVHPEVRDGFKDTQRFADIVNSFTSSEGYSLKIVNYIDSFPLYKFVENTQQEYIKEVEIPNNIKFYHTKNTSEYRWSLPDLTSISELTLPSFILCYTEWNDYGSQTSFHLYYLESQDNLTAIGFVKIMKQGEDYTKNFIPNSFFQLGNTFYSLGQSWEYYNNLKILFGDNYFKIAHALNDVALLPSLSENIEKDYIFINSLLRETEAKQTYKNARLVLSGYSINDSFTFSFETLISKETGIPHKTEFNFSRQSKLPYRINALIGRNGTGKTQYLSKLALALGRETKDIGGVFSPSTPVFSKVIAVSFSAFDRFERPKKKRSFSYCYCGLMDEEHRVNEEFLSIRFISAIEVIIEKNRVWEWENILSIIIPIEFIKRITPVDRETRTRILDKEIYFEEKKLLSSGQGILLHVLTEIIANIKESSLILFDEPETHLHPNAIAHLIRAIHKLLEAFDSYAIIATHSPIIIQEIPSKHVKVFERLNGNIPSIRDLEIESFGENISTITQDIFETREVEATYKDVLRDLSIKYSMEEILALFWSGPLQFRLYYRQFTIINELIVSLS